MIDNLNLHALRIFGIVAKTGSITRAAEQLYISQPAVTKQLRNLEQELGLPLVATSGRGIRLTEAGQAIARAAMKLDGLHADTHALAKRFREGQAGSVRVCATYLPANFLLPRRIAAYKREYPDVRLSLTTVNAEHAFRMLLEYEADLAVIGGTAAQPDGLERTEWVRDEAWFVVPSDHPLAGRKVKLAEMLEEAFVVREEGSSMREMLFALCRVHGLTPPRLGLQMGGLQETIRTIAAGYGAGFVSALEVKEAIERGELAQVHVEESKGLFNAIAVYQREGERLPPAADALFNRLR